MKAIYEVTVKAEDFNDKTDDKRARVAPLQTGDSIFIVSSDPVNVGDRYDDYAATIVEVYYEPKRWWGILEEKETVGISCGVGVRKHE